MEFKEINLGHGQSGEVILDYKRDITYSSESNQELHLHVIYPVAIGMGEQHKHPVLLYFMASPDTKQDFYHNMPRLTQFAQRGYAVVVMEQPLLEGSFEIQQKLVNDAVSTLAQQADEFSLDIDNIFLLRDGTHEQATMDLNFENIRLQPSSPRFRGIICFGGQKVIEQICEKLEKEMSPVCMIPASKEHTLELWTEEVFDHIEDFMSNYIR